MKNKVILKSWHQIYYHSSCNHWSMSHFIIKFCIGFMFKILANVQTLYIVKIFENIWSVFALWHMNLLLLYNNACNHYVGYDYDFPYYNEKYFSCSSNSSRNSSRGPRAKTTNIISSASTRGKTANSRRSSRSTSVTSVPATEDIIATSQLLSTTKTARKPSSSASTYTYNRTSSTATSQSKTSEAFSFHKLTTSESNSSTGAIKKQYTVAHQQEVSVRSSNRRQRNGNNNNNNVTITGSSVRVGASAAWDVNSDKNSPLDTVSCKSYSTSTSCTHPGSSQSGKSIGRGRKRDLTSHSASNNQIITGEYTSHFHRKNVPPFHETDH